MFNHQGHPQGQNLKFSILRGGVIYHHLLGVKKEKSGMRCGVGRIREYIWIIYIKPSNHAASPILKPLLEFDRNSKEYALLKF